MSKPNEREAQFTGLVWPGALVVVSALYAYYTSQSQLESSRPAGTGNVTSPVGPGYLGKVHARVWEDPFEGPVEHHEKTQKSPSSPDFVDWQCPDTIEDLHRHFAGAVARARKPGGRFLVLPVLVNGGPFAADREQRIRTRYAVSAALGASGLRLRYPDRISYVVPRIHVDVGGTPDGEEVDLVVPLKLYSRDEVPRFDNTLEECRPERAATKSYDSVLVLWIDESRLGTSPLYGLANVLVTMFGPEGFVKPKQADGTGGITRKDSVDGECDRKKPEPRRLGPDDFDLRILGPFDSNSLLAMANEKCTGRNTRMASEDDPAPPSLPEVYAGATLYSARATVSDTALRESEAARLRAFVDPEKDAARGPSVVRVVGDDRHLVKALRRELEIRGAWPSTDNRDRTLVLVTEHDTLYGRGMASLFHRELADSLEVPPDRLPPAFSREFFYLRGIDGRLPSTKTEKKDSDEKGGGKEDERPKYVEPRPESRSQYDYMHRLRQNLEDYNREVKQQGYTGITCIGIVGSDVYDELLIMRALRAGFPEAIFFTTDLHAQLGHEEEIDQTQNLIVASHFGLRLSENLQRGVGEFRDCYQTSTYLACLLAVDDPRARTVLDCFPSLGSRPWRFDLPNAGLRPLVFELGRTQPYQLTKVGFSHTSGFYDVDEQGRSIQSLLPSGAVQSPSPREVPWFYPWYVLWALLVAGVLAGVSYRLLPRVARDHVGRVCSSLVAWPDNVGHGIAWGLAGVLACFLLSVAVDQYRADGEPLSFCGISIWPTSFVRLLIPCVAASFVWVVQSRSGEPPTTGADGDAEEETVDDRPKPFVCRDVEEGQDGIHGYRFQKRVLWLLGTAFVVFALMILTSWMFNSPRLPSRGWLSRVWGHPVRWAAHVSALFAFLLYFDLCEYVRRCVRERAEALKKATFTDPEAHEAAVHFVHQVGVRTNAVGKLFAWPAVVLMLLIASAAPGLDYAAISEVFLGFFALAFALVLAGAFVLRKQAITARDELAHELTRAKEELVLRRDDATPGPARSRSTKKSSSKKASAGDTEARGATMSPEGLEKRIDFVLATLRSEHHGAFRPLGTSPLVQWVLFGGAGSYLALQMLANMM